MLGSDEHPVRGQTGARRSGVVPVDGDRFEVVFGSVSMGTIGWPLAVAGGRFVSSLERRSPCSYAGVLGRGARGGVSSRERRLPRDVC